MSHFLNREKFNFWIPKLITKAEEEVVLIVPYIKTSTIVFNALKQANKKNKRIVIVYRENKLDGKEKQKLLSLENLDLLHHPNIHCKCYYNGDLLIIGSMNLYEYSEKNNREMGYLINCIDEDEVNEIYDVDCLGENYVSTIYDAKAEIRKIINGSTLEKKSKITIQSGFNLNITKTTFEHKLNECNYINQYFDNKKFVPFKVDLDTDLEYLEFYEIVSKNYFDNIDLYLEETRLALHLNIDKKERVKIFNLWKKEYNLYRFKGFKNYWNSECKPIYIYKDRKYDFWDKNEENDKKILNAYQKGLKKVFEYYQKLKKEI